jgi:hypothetical protein
MKTLLKLEEAALFSASIYLFSRLPFAWWWFPALLLLPDLSMVGYLVDTRVGAVLYNLVHHKATALVVGLASQPLLLAGVILLAHTTLDRMLGYGLKYPDSFKHTSEGWVGNRQSPV